VVPRFLVPGLDAGAREASLPREEAHHLSRVMRMQVGDQVAVFDGRGLVFLASVASIGRERATVTLLAPITPRPAPALSLTLVQAVLKAAFMDEVVRDCTMVGVDVVQPVVSERTAVKLSTLERAADRWRRVALSSTKQCGRSRLPEIREVEAFEEWIGSGPLTGALVLLEPSAVVPGTMSVRDVAESRVGGAATLLVGPEGGWTPAERDRAIAAGCRPLSLGRLTLRADAVPLVAASMLLALSEPAGARSSG
jgi:16S rRNA (uracil1498-N3)-methyltransferase